MSLTDLLPARISRPRPARKHRAVDEVDRLREQLDGANALIRGLQLQVAERDQALAGTGAKQAEAEMVVVCQQATIDDLTAHRDELLTEVTALKERFGPELAAEANANAIDVPPMARIGADQETVPQGIDVRPLWAAADAGLLGPVTDPGHIGPDDTQPIPAA